MNEFIYDGKEINYTLKRSKRKTVGITITEEAEVIITVPMNLKKVYIDEVLEKRGAWIIEKIELMKKRELKEGCRKFQEGEKFYLLGKVYALKILSYFKVFSENPNNKINAHTDMNYYHKQINEEKDNKNNVYIDACNLCVIIGDNLYDNNDEARVNYIKSVIKKFYVNRALEFFKERMEFFSKEMQLYPKKITVKDVKTLWGSCSSRGNISLNWKLIMAPPHIIDYVIVHELCHLRHMNHSRDFWWEVEKVIPDYKYRRKWLKDNGYLYKL